MATRRMSTSMVFVFYLLMATLSLSVAQMNLYITKDDVNSYLKMNFDFDLYLIKDNEPAQLLRDSRAFYEFMSPLISSIKGVKMSWFSSPKRSSYSLKFLSSDTEMMQQPISSISNEGIISHSTFSFYVSLVCTGKKAGIVDATMMLNYSSIVNNVVQRDTLKQFTVTVRRYCDKTVKDPDKPSGGMDEWSRGAIVGLSAGITVFLCVSVGLGLLLKHYLKQRRLKMEFEDDLDIEEKREFGLRKVRSLPIHRPHPSTSASPPPVIFSPKRPKFGIARPRQRSETNASDISTVGLICPGDSDDEGQRSRQSTSGASNGGYEAVSRENLGSSKSWSKVFAGMLINPAHLERKQLINKGTLCNVYYGLLSESCSQNDKEVAIKCLRDGAAPEAVKTFVEEVLVVKDLQHPNLMTPMGVLLQPSSTPQLVMPYMKYEELNKFLRQEQDLSSQQVLNLGCQIAKAMDYLATRDCVHKNLTSAYCMVGDGYQVKVIYNSKEANNSEDGKKWMAPECLNNWIFSQKSDVWSFGVILWEMASAGQLPYQDQDSQSLLEYLLAGSRLPQPKNCPDQLDETSASTTHTPFVRYVVSPGNTKDGEEKPAIRAQGTCHPDVELQCRVIKKWQHLNTLIVDVIPWCLLLNNTVSTIFIKDVENEKEIQLPAGQTIAPYKFKGKIQLGILVSRSSTLSWSKPLTLPFSDEVKDSASAKKAHSPDEPHHSTVYIAHVSTSARPVAVTWTMTTQTCHSVRVLSVQEKYYFVNTSGKPLLLLPVLAAPARKIPSDVLDIARAIPLPADSRVKVPVACWDIALTSSVVMDEKGVASVDDATPVAFFALGERKVEGSSVPQDDTSVKLHTELTSRQWSQVFVITSDLPRSSIAIPEGDGRTTIPVAITHNIVAGITNIVMAIDSSPRLVIHNDCPFTLQFGQATPPRSPSYQKGSPEKVVVVEQLEPFYEVPEIAAFGMTHYELPVMREWLKTSSEVQEIPNIHIQALYNVTVAEISEDAEGRISPGQTTEVPQGWTHGLDINSNRHFVVNLPGRGRVLVFVSTTKLCTAVRIQIYDQDNVSLELPSNEALPASFDVTVNVSKLEISLVDAGNQRKPSEILRTTIFGISLCNSPLMGHPDEQSVASELTLTLNSFQLDNQLEGELFQFPVVLLSNDSLPSHGNTTVQRKSRAGTSSKPFLSIKIKYEPNMETTFLHSVLVSCEPVTVFLEDTLVYRLVMIAESFLPPAHEHDLLADKSVFEITLLVNQCSSILNPLIIGKFEIEPVTIHLTLHASMKLFIGMEDTSLSLGQFHMSPVYLPTSAFAQKVLFHYMSSVMFKIGWVVGSLELLGNPAGLIRNFSQGISDFFFLPYDGLTRGPGAFVSGMSQGVSSFVRHVSTGALTSVTSLASSISRNLDRLCMDEDHIRLLEEQRCRRPTRLVAGITQGLSGFGLSLLGAVAGVVDQPIQGIQRANDIKQAASGVITGVGKGLLGVVTKPIGGAMELVSQTGQGILQGAGLSQLPSRLHTLEDGLVIDSRNSLLKYSWKVLQLKGNPDIFCTDVTVVTATGHDYSGALLLTSSMIYITSTDTDTIQQSFDLRNTVVEEDERDNRTIIVTSVPQSTSFDDYTIDNPETGDPERMKQFLRDTQMFAEVSQADSSADFSAESILTSKLKLIIDPISRDYFISRFTTVKYKLMI